MNNQTADAARQPLSGALEWIDRYAAAVAEQLPARRGADIQMEVRSLLLDEMEQIAPSGTPTEAQVIEVLERYPSPAEMAKRYGATTSLIGPAYYPGYIQTLQLVVTVVFWLAVIGAIFDASVGPGRFAPLEVLWETGSAIFVSAGIVTIIFAIVERSYSRSSSVPIEAAGEESGKDRWKVRGLSPVSDPNRVTLTESFTAIVTSLVSVLFLIFLAVRGGAVPVRIGDEWTSYAVLSDGLLAALPWLIVLWTTELLVYIAVLALRRWTVALRLLVLAIQLAALGILLWLLVTVQLTTLPWLEWIARVVVIFVAVITASEATGQVRGLVRQRRSA